MGQAEGDAEQDGARASEDLRVLRLVVSDFVDVCVSIADGQWDRSTPCPEWTLEQLVDHVTGGNRFTVRILSGDSAEAAMAAAVQSFAHGHDVRLGAVSSIEELQAAFVAPGALDRVCNHVAGDLTGHQALRLRLHDLIVHTWDIAQSVRPPASIGPELVEWGMGELAAPDSLAERHFGIEPEAAWRGRGPAAAAYLAAFGRSLPPGNPAPCITPRAGADDQDGREERCDGVTPPR